MLEMLKIPQTRTSVLLLLTSGSTFPLLLSLFIPILKAHLNMSQLSRDYFHSAHAQSRDEYTVVKCQYERRK